MSMSARHIGAWVALILVCTPVIASAQSAADLQQQIDDHNAQIAQLNAEIAQYQTQLDATSAKKQTLQTQLTQLNLSIKKTTASINLTKNQISATQLQIQQLSTGISKTQTSIDTEQAGLEQSIRALAEEENQPLAIQLLSAGNISEIWNDFTTTQELSSAIDTHITNLASAKQTLTNTKSATEDKQTQLLKQQKTLLTQQGSLSATQKAQSDLLAQTKSQESNYQAIVAQKKAQESSFEQELANLKAQYNQAVNPSQITAAAPGILAWPIGGTIRITQYFGDTPFADAHAALYSGHGHDGLDIAAPIGTPVHAALTGTILAIGNTDAIKGCYSFGKWVMIKHSNGLNTMYAHLSEIDVSAGEQVSTGDVIGYSGETGYATGPHLHFGVYVSSVTKIIPLGQATGGTAPCSRATMPVPPVSGYLNPLNYLPAL
jgi:murein DD-endopeptidase MepM/ murein hydrolase activator NlpD